MDGARTIGAAGVDFHARQRGEEPSAIFLHGFGADLHTWDDLWRELGDDFPALRYDLRGFGKSPAGDGEPFSHAEDLLAILDSLGIASCDLVGVSMGGGVALNFSLTYPQRVNRLVLICPGMVAWEWSEEWKALWRPIIAHARQGEMDEARALWWRHPLFAATRRSPGAQKLYAAIQRFSGAQWVKDNERAELPDVDRLHLLKVPTLLLSGADDVQEFRLQADLIAAGAPDVRRVDLPGIGHLPQLEDPALCARHIDRFLGDGTFSD